MASLTRSHVVSPSHDDLLPAFYPRVHVATQKDGGSLIRQRKSLPRYGFWQPNDFNTIAALVVDIDERDAWLMPALDIIKKHKVLRPSWLLHKSANGHGQMGWLIEPVSTGPRSHEKPIHYAEAVRANLTTAFGGDPLFVNKRCWNPLHVAWKRGEMGDLSWGIIQPRSLGTITTALKAADLWESRPSFRTYGPHGGPAPLALDDALGRNDYVFNRTRCRPRGLTVRQAAEAYNSTLPSPLPQRECDTIIRSIERYEREHQMRRHTGEGQGNEISDEFRAIQSARGRIGGSRNTPAQQQARARRVETASMVRAAEAEGRAAAIRAYLAQGLSVGEVMARTGASRATVYRAKNR